MPGLNSPRVDRRSALAAGGGIAGGLLCASTGIFGASADAADAAPLILDGVTIVNTHDGSLIPNMRLTIKNGKIANIAPAGGSSSPDSAHVVAAHGKFVVPGYNDLHAHPLSSPDPEGSLALMLASGITGFREMAAWGTMLDRRRQGTLMPPGAGPELLEMAGEILTPANAGTPEIAVAEIQKQKAAGADFIKIIDYSPDVFFAVADACERLDMRFLGHLSPTIDVRKAATAGMRSIEHMGPRDSVLLGCSTDEVALRPAFQGAPPLPPMSGQVPIGVISRLVANPTVMTPPAELARYQRVMITFSVAKSRDLASHFAAAGTWNVPTLIRVRTMLVGDDQRYRTDPNLKYVPKQTVQMWQEVSQQFDATISPEARTTLLTMYGQLQQLVKPFKDAGVNMMTGSDFSGGFVVAGFGLHDEFDRLGEAGLSPLDVLQMTTLNGAKFLGREATMGSVTVGKDANLVLLDANPIASVQNLHGIAAVVRAGLYLSVRDLEAMKTKTADRIASGAIAMTPPRPFCCLG